MSAFALAKAYGVSSHVLDSVAIWHGAATIAYIIAFVVPPSKTARGPPLRLRPRSGPAQPRSAGFLGAGAAAAAPSAAASVRALASSPPPLGPPPPRLRGDEAQQPPPNRGRLLPLPQVGFARTTFFAFRMLAPGFILGNAYAAWKGHPQRLSEGFVGFAIQAVGVNVGGAIGIWYAVGIDIPATEQKQLEKESEL